jgi:uncharacterized protein (DUF58 family)
MRLDPATLASIADLELVARITVDGTLSGLHRSPFHGYSAEFSQYRHYQPGDDLKYVDWKLFARTDRFYTKQYRETTNMVAAMVVDASASMGFKGRNGIRKLDYARLAAAALAHLIVSQGDAAGLVVFDEAVRQFLPARPGRIHLRNLMIALARLEAAGPSATGPALERAAELMKRRGLLLIFSDLYDESEEVEAALRRAVSIGHELSIFHVLTPDELEFPIDGAVEIEDVESHATVVTNATTIRAEYLAQVRQFIDRWRSRSEANGIDYSLVVTGKPLESMLRPYLLKRSESAVR